MIATPPPPLPLSVDHMNQLSSNSSTPYMSPASSPQRPALNFFYSAPTSPRSYANHSSFDDLYDDYNDEDHQEHTQRKEKEEEEEEKTEDDFQFDFSGQLDMMIRPSLSSADELFHGGKIRPLKLKPPPNSLQINNDNNKITSDCHSPKSPKSTMSKFKDALSMSPKHRRNLSDFGPDPDPFEVAIRNTRRRDSNGEVQNRERGRCRGGNNNRKGISRSLSPLRVSEFALLQDQAQQNPNEPGNLTGLFQMGSSNNACSRKWRLKDLFLFRSASEGHYKDTQSFSKRWSFRSSSIVSGSGSGSGSESGSVSKRRVQGASHEMMYTKNRAVAEELKKKTMLPYRHGLLACLGFSPVLPQFSYAFPNTPPS